MPGMPVMPTRVKVDKKTVVPDHHESTSPPADATTAYGDVIAESPPDVPRYGGGGGGETAVDTQAIKTFSENLSTLRNALNASYAEISGTGRVAAGGFPSAHLLADNTGTLVGQTATSLLNMVEALTDLQAATAKVATDYETTAEANDLSAAQLTRYMNEVNSSISAVSSAGTASGPA